MNLSEIYASHYQALHRPSAVETDHEKETEPNKADNEEDHFYAPLNLTEDQNIYGPEVAEEPVYNVLETPVDELIYQNHGSVREEPVDDCAEAVYIEVISEEGTSFGNTLERSYQYGAEGPNNDPESMNEPIYNVVEEDPDLEGSNGSDHDGVISEEGTSFGNTLERSYQDGADGPSNDPESINEPIYNVVEEDPYLEGSNGSDHDGVISEEGTSFGITLERSYQDGAEGPNNDLEFMNEPIYNVVEEDPYLESSNGSDHDGVVSKEGPVYGNTLERPYQHGAEGPNNDPESMNEPIYNVVEEDPYLEGSNGSDHDGVISEEGTSFGITLERSYQDGAEGPNNDLEFMNEPIYNVVEEDPYLEGSNGSDCLGVISEEEPIGGNTLEGSYLDGDEEPYNDHEFINEPIYINVIKQEPCEIVSTEDDSFVTRDFVKNILKNLTLERRETSGTFSDMVA